MATADAEAPPDDAEDSSDDEEEPAPPPNPRRRILHKRPASKSPKGNGRKK